jgi:hypothetical protein
MDRLTDLSPMCACLGKAKHPFLKPNNSIINDDLAKVIAKIKLSTH